MKTKLLKIIYTYGIENQQRKYEEEVFELQQAIINYRNAEIMKKHVRENDLDINLDEFKRDIEKEMADNCVLLMQFANYFDLDITNIRKDIDYKLDRQIDRIEAEK